MVKLEKFIFPMDFIVFDIEEDGQIPLILGRPFLPCHTSGAQIDVTEGKVIMRVEDKQVTFNALKSRDFTPKFQTCNKVDDLTSRPIMAKPTRTQPLKIEPTKPSIDVFKEIDPTPKVQTHVLVDEKPKEVSKPYMAEPSKAKTINHHANLSKHNFEECNPHPPLLDTPFYHPT